jgi:shikimate kinase
MPRWTFSHFPLGLSGLESTIRVGYSRAEVASTLDEVQHQLVREAMRRVEIDEPLEITTTGDVPSGTGMGSSSNFESLDTAAVSSSSTTKKSFPETRCSMKPFIATGRLVYDRALPMLLCFELGWIMENVDGPTG